MGSSYAPLFRSLASMHRAGIPWSRAVESATGGDVRFDGVSRALDEGTSFADALRPVVDPLDAALIEAGERDGSLEVMLETIASTHDEASRLRRERTTRAIYPLFLGHLGAGLMVVFGLFSGDLLGGLMWAMAILAPLWAYLGLQRALDRRDRPAPGAGTPPAPPPVVWPFRNGIEEADARALQALGHLYEAGVPIGEALPLAVRAGWGGRAAVDLQEARVRVDRGESLGGTWSRLPDRLAMRLVSAEESGSLGAALRQAAGDLRFDVETRRQRAAQILPVILILVVGAVFAMRLFSFYGGYYRNLGR